MNYLKEELKLSLSEHPKLTGHGKYYQGTVYDYQDLKHDIVIP